MAEVQANVAITDVTVRLSEAEASRLRTILRSTMMWTYGGVLGDLAADIDTSLAELCIPASPVQLKYSEQYGAFVEKVPS